MKSIIKVLVFVLLLSNVGFSQSSCCVKPNSSAAFASLANNESFVNMHLSPLPLDFQPTVGKMINLKPIGGKEVRAFEVKSGSTVGKVILMFHEWWGLNEYIQREAEKLHIETGYTVLAIDLYEGKSTMNPDEAGKLMQAVDQARARSIIQAGIEYAGKQGKIQTIGWCMGGGWSLQAAILAGTNLKGCIMYYGMPETDSEKLQKLNGPVLGLFAKKDAWITPEVVQKFEKQMKDLGKTITVESYDADHAFANPSNPKYNKEASAEAHKLVLEFLNKNFETK